MQSKVTISGNIISELSEKIPSNIIALNELIKNSYDAGASAVKIILDSRKKKLSIIDNGEGMDKSDIDTLFHISSSTKVYGKYNEKYNRYVQGSKGLGFLSIFKFGKYVQWKTKKEKGYYFCLNYDELIKQYDISGCQIELVEDDTIDYGTAIEIDVDEYNMKSLLNFFSEEKNYKKVLNSFDDSSFDIVLSVDGSVYKSSETQNICDIVPDSQLYRVIYDSDEEKIKFFYNNEPAFEKKFTIDSSRFKLELELVIFDLQPYGKSKIDKLYYNPNDDLTPLLYINRNLFNNYDMFDPNVMKNIKLSLVLNQMIGKIEIISSDNEMSFNSDRSQFLQNELTDQIKDILKKLNMEIQGIGGKNKKYLKNFDIINNDKFQQECEKFKEPEDFRKCIYSDFDFKEKVQIRREENNVIFSLFGKENVIAIPEKSSNQNKKSKESKNKGNLPKTMKAEINLNSKDEIVLDVPSEQIDLYTYIASVRNSRGDDIDIKELKIKVDGKVSGGILQSITKSEIIKVEYSFNDSITGLVVKELTMRFIVKMSDFSTHNTRMHLIMLQSRQGYTLNFNPYINKIIEEVNSLDINTYKEIIACCLRSLFEISVDAIVKCGKYPDFFINERELTQKVAKVVDFIKSNPKFMGEVATATAIDYKSLGNMLDKEAFEKGVGTAHLGAHKSTYYISEMEIDNLAKLIALFLVLVNEMINNPNIRDI